MSSTPLSKCRRTNRYTFICKSPKFNALYRNTVIDTPRKAYRFSKETWLSIELHCYLFAEITDYIFDWYDYSYDHSELKVLQYTSDSQCLQPITVTRKATWKESHRIYEKKKYIAYYNNEKWTMIVKSLKFI